MPNGLRNIRFAMLWWRYGSVPGCTDAVEELVVGPPEMRDIPSDASAAADEDDISSPFPDDENTADGADRLVQSCVEKGVTEVEPSPWTSSLCLRR